MVLAHHVLPLSDVRARLSEFVARFRAEGPTSEMIVFGTQRRPEAVLVPYTRLEKLLQLEQEERRRSLDQATGSTLAEGLRTSPQADAIAQRWVDGEITEDQMVEETVRQYRRL